VKHARIDGKKPTPAAAPVEELTPRSDPPADRYTHKVIMNVFGKRFELTRHTEVRVITSGPAKVIEMPTRPPIES
jgi:hypothetical protein